MRFPQMPHYERFEDFDKKWHAVFFSQMKKKLEKLATFAKNDYFCTVKTPCFGGYFSQETVSRISAKSFAKIFYKEFV